MSCSVLLSMLQRSLLRSTVRDLATTARLICCVSETDVKKKKNVRMMGKEELKAIYSPVLLPVFPHVMSGQTEAPQGTTRL